jgi:hypothetical protein
MMKERASSLGGTLIAQRIDSVPQPLYRLAVDGARVPAQSLISELLSDAEDVTFGLCVPVCVALFWHVLPLCLLFSACEEFFKLYKPSKIILQATLELFHSSLEEVGLHVYTRTPFINSPPLSPSLF